jgi:hypothetical protein
VDDYISVSRFCKGRAILFGAAYFSAEKSLSLGAFAPPECPEKYSPALAKAGSLLFVKKN